ncbi:putative global transcription activator SNF2L1 [Termitomyces sp. T112]|nr:putative global transcription activator SNF2L1 [Termitomyces sp. T112]
MFRASSRLVPRRAVLAASVAASGVILHTPPEKLSIYSAPTPDVLLVEEPSALEREIGVVRRKVSEVLFDTHSQIQAVVSRWIGIEHAIENRVKSIISPNEPLTPGLLYVGVATLSGSILARNRTLATRLLLPPIFLFASAKHFFPQTTENFTSYLGSLEDTYFPTLAEKHVIANAHTQMAWERLKDASQNGREWVNRGAATAVDKIQEATGLKLNETLGWSQAGLKHFEAKASEVAKAAEERIVEGKVTVEKTLDENKGEQAKKVEESKRLV